MLKEVKLTNLHSGKIYKTMVQSDDDTKATIGSGKINAESADITDIEGASALFYKLPFTLDKMTTDEKVAFFSGMAKCLERNIGIMKSVQLQSNRVKSPKFRGLIGDVAEDLATGEKLSDALTKDGKVFGEDIKALLQAGEEAGQVGDVCARIAESSKKSNKIAKKLKAGMVYPAIVITLALGVVILMSFTLVPNMKNLYSNLKAPLPKATKVMMAFSDILIHKPYLAILPFIGLYMVFKNWGKIAATKKAQTFFIKIPTIGKIVRKNALATCFRVFAMLMDSNVRMAKALDITCKSAPHWHMKTFFTNVKNHVQEGKSLPESFYHEAHWLGEEGRTICGMMEVAGETGSGTEMLNEIAQDYEEDLDNVASQIDKIIEPFTIVVLGILIAGLIWAIYAPVFKLGGAMFGGG